MRGKGLPGYGKGASSSASGARGGRAKPKTNVRDIKTGKALTPSQVKARAKVDRFKKSPAAEDMRKGNLDNFNKIVRGKVKPANKSVFGPIATGKVKPKPKPKGK